MKKNLKRYTKEQLQKLKDKVRIEDVISVDYKLLKHNKNYYCECPFCGKNNTLSIAIKKQFAYCNACKVAFDVFGYLHQVKGIPFTDAVLQIKRTINLNSNIEMQKLLKASMHLQVLLKGINPINQQPLIGKIFADEETVSVLSKMYDMVMFFIDDYLKLDKTQIVEKLEVANCKRIIENILSFELLEDSLCSEKLKNLFKFLLHKLTLVEENWYNMGGIAHI